MKKIFLLTALFLLSFASLYSQTVLMGDAGYPQSNPADCNTFGVSGTNFQDPGGGANYPANYNDTITFCPDLTLGTKMSITMAINAGFTFDVDGSDFIYVYDGPTASSPLLGVHNSVTDPTGFTHQASWNNPSGCLTVVFVSNGSVQGTGWDANVQCGNQFQPFTPHLQAYVNGTGPNAIDPIDTGYIDVCFGDSILIVATPSFPYSLESTGYGYSQNVNSTIDFDWYVTDGNTYPNNDSIWFTPPARAGYLIDLKLTDDFPQVDHIICKVRVSQLPSFAGTGPLEDTVCLGQNTNLLGGVTATDTVGVSIPEGNFNLGGNFAGLTYLPDGSGQQYQAPISIGGFPAGATISNAQDLNQVCITMEHSYLGDLEIWLQCPNGTTVPLVNSYNPGFIPGGNSGGGTFMGHPYDDSGGGGAGEGWEYCFSSVFNTIGPLTSNLGNTVPVAAVAGTPPLSAGNSMDPSSVYAPETTFASLAGCPVNGNWTIFVQDNLGIDDGYIFEWGLYFDQSFFPGMQGYQNIVVSDFWSSDPTIVSGQNDTLIVVQPNSPGNYSYQYNIVDDFGCEYDTTVTLFVQPLPTIFDNGLGCFMTYQVQGTTSYAGGVWSCADTAIVINTPTMENPQIATSTPGTYTVTYTDNACNNVLTAEIYYPPYAWTETFDSVICEGASIILSANVNSTVNSFLWSTGETTPNITVNSPGNYIVTGSNECYTIIDTATIGNKICSLIAPNIVSLSSTVGNNIFFVQYDGIAEFNCSILNRWGNVIYEYSDPAGGWDGKTSGGDLVDEGTYFYIIKATFEGGREVTEHGFVQLKY
ncbi:MAG: hypothetical protein RI922_322 [Bacteroidota bacterium]|jgi:hypothetical protein